MPQWVNCCGTQKLISQYLRKLFLSDQPLSIVVPVCAGVSVFCVCVYTQYNKSIATTNATHIALPLLKSLKHILAPSHGPPTRYVKLRVAHAQGMPGTFSQAPRVSNLGMHYGTCVTHVPWCMLGSLTSGFLWSRWRGKRSRHSRRMRNPPFYVSGKRPIEGVISNLNSWGPFYHLG